MKFAKPVMVLAIVAVSACSKPAEVTITTTPPGTEESPAPFVEPVHTSSNSTSINNIEITDPNGRLAFYEIKIHTCQSPYPWEIHCVLTYNQPKNYGVANAGNFKAIAYGNDNVILRTYPFPDEDLKPSTSALSQIMSYPKLEEIKRIEICEPMKDNC